MNTIILITILYHNSVGKNFVDADYFDFTKEIQSSHRAPRFTIGDRVRITKYKNVFGKGYTKKRSSERFDIA